MDAMPNRQRSRRLRHFALPGGDLSPARQSDAEELRCSLRGGRSTLRQDALHAAAAPDTAFLFANLAGCYVPQHDEHSCSVASVVMLINAIRAGRAPGKSARVITPPELLKRVGSPEWISAVGPDGDGVGLEELAGLVGKSLDVCGIEQWIINVVHVSSASRAARTRVRDALRRAGQSRNCYLLANFLQSVYTGNRAATIGHHAPVAGYDDRRRVFILDPDSRWHEPYWVSEDDFLKGMATYDETTGKPRGYLSIRIGPET
jgi:hypothetical protein